MVKNELRLGIWNNNNGEEKGRGKFSFLTEFSQAQLTAGMLPRCYAWRVTGLERGVTSGVTESEGSETERVNWAWQVEGFELQRMNHPLNIGRARSRPLEQYTCPIFIIDLFFFSFLLISRNMYTYSASAIYASRYPFLHLILPFYYFTILCWEFPLVHIPVSPQNSLEVTCWISRYPHSAGVHFGIYYYY